MSLILLFCLEFEFLMRFLRRLFSRLVTAMSVQECGSIFFCVCTSYRLEPQHVKQEIQENFNDTSTSDRI